MACSSSNIPYNPLFAAGLITESLADILHVERNQRITTKASAFIRMGIRGSDEAGNLNKQEGKRREEESSQRNREEKKGNTKKEKGNRR